MRCGTVGHGGLVPVQEGEDVVVVVGLADPEELDALARDLEAQAEEVRARYRLFRTQVTEVRWQSAGAADYRRHCEALVADLERNAAELEAAAGDLRAHAQAVRDRIAWMHEMVDDLRRRAEEAWDDAQGAFAWGKDKADDAWRTVTGWL